MPEVGRIAKEDHIQSILFKKEGYTVEEAKSWLKEHDFYTDGLDETDQLLRFRQYDPDAKKFYYRTKRISKYISYIFGFEKKSFNGGKDKMNVDKKKNFRFHGQMISKQKTKKGLEIEGLASMEKSKRDSDIIPPQAFNLDIYRTNPQLWYNHTMWRDESGNEIPIGNVPEVRVVTLVENENKFDIVDYESEEIIKSIEKEKAPNAESGDAGLWCKAIVNVSKVIELIEQGDLNTFSWAGMVEWDEKGLDEGEYIALTIDLLEISVVSIPANEGAVFNIRKGLISGNDVKIKSISSYDKVLPYRDYSIHKDKTLDWDKNKCEKTIEMYGDKNELKRYFMLKDSKSGQYGLPYVYITKDGVPKVIWKAIESVMDVINSDSSFSDSIRKSIYKQLQKYYAKFEETIPELISKEDIMNDDIKKKVEDVGFLKKLYEQLAQIFGTSPSVEAEREDIENQFKELENNNFEEEETEMVDESKEVDVEKVVEDEDIEEVDIEDLVKQLADEVCALKNTVDELTNNNKDDESEEEEEEEVEDDEENEDENEDDEISEKNAKIEELTKRLDALENATPRRGSTKTQKANTGNEKLDSAANVFWGIDE